MKRVHLLSSFIFGTSLLVPLGVQGQAPTAKVSDAPLIPRSAIFGNPERAFAQLSPDGKYVSFLAPRDGVLNVWGWSGARHFPLRGR